MTEVLSKVASDDNSDNLSTNAVYLMTLEQKDWLMAMINRDQPKMTTLLRDSPELANWKNHIDGNTALHYAAKFYDTSLMRLLLGNYKVDVNAQNHDGLTPLHYAAMSGNEDAIFLLTSSYNANFAIRDFGLRLPVDYLPKTNAGQNLKKFLPDTLQTLLKKPGSALNMLENNDSAGQYSPPFARPRPASGLETADSSDSHPTPVSAQFPWQQKVQTNGDDKRLSTSTSSLQRHGQYLLTGLSRRGKRGSEIDVHEIQHVRVIHASIKRHRELKTPLFNPLNPQATSNAETIHGYSLLPPTNLRSLSSRHAVGQHIKRDSSLPCLKTINQSDETSKSSPDSESVVVATTNVDAKEGDTNFVRSNDDEELDHTPRDKLDIQSEVTE